jgi:hypothetical protein
MAADAARRCRRFQSFRQHLLTISIRARKSMQMPSRVSPSRIAQAEQSYEQGMSIDGT